VLPSDDCDKNVNTVGTVSSKNKTAAGTENKENEITVCVTSSRGSKEQNNSQDEVNVNEELSSRQEIKKDLSDNGTSNDCSNEDKSKEHPEKPAVSVSDVEIKLEKLEITCSETEGIEGQLKKLAINSSDGDGKLSERSPMGNERLHRHSYKPYAVSFSSLSEDLIVDVFEMHKRSVMQWNELFCLSKMF
jgi:hypothetical protein